MNLADEIFEYLEANRSGDLDYSYHSSNDMDNIESMHKFLENHDLTEYVDEDDGTLVYLKHPNYDFTVAVTSSGLGDFFSHGIYI